MCMTASGWLSDYSVSVTYAVGRGFAPRPGHTKDRYKNGTICIPAWHAVRSGRSLTLQPGCLKTG